MLLSPVLTVPYKPQYNYLTIYTQITLRTPRLYYRFVYGLGIMETDALDLRIHIKVISRTGKGSFIDDSFSLRYPSAAEILAAKGDSTKLSSYKTFDSDISGFKNYDSYTECGEIIQGDPIFPDSETIRITCDGVEGYYDVTLSNKKDVNSVVSVKIPIEQGTSWSA